MHKKRIRPNYSVKRGENIVLYVKHGLSKIVFLLLNFPGKFCIMRSINTIGKTLQMSTIAFTIAKV